MLQRKIGPVLVSAARNFPVLTLLGPRQSGKTTLVRHLFPHHTYLNLENPETRSYLAQDPKSLLGQGKSNIIIDEVQRVPEVLSWVQIYVDENRSPGQFILTGSNQPELGSAVAQSLAGRTGIYYLFPLSCEELGPVSQDRDSLLVKGFMPRLYQESEFTPSPSDYYSAYYATYVERDVRALLQLQNLNRFDTFLRLLAGRVGQLTNLSALSGDVGVSSTTLSQWLSILEASFIVFRLQPYFSNLGKRLVKTPKIYFTEPGLLAWLLQIESGHQVARDPLLGPIFENMVVMEALKGAYNRGVEPRLSFYRDKTGLEVDLVREQNRAPRAVEIKAGRTFTSEMISSVVKFQKLGQSPPLPGGLVYAGEKGPRVQGVQILPYLTTAPFLYDS